MNFFWVAIAVVVFGGLFFLWWQKRQESQEWDDYKRSRSSAEGVAETQRLYEEHLLEEIDLPSGVHGRALYIYRALMRVWFARLVAGNQHDEAALKKLRLDWLNYMRMIDTRQTAYLMAAVTEGSGEATREGDAKEIGGITKQIAAIEDAFALAIGSEAVESLRRIRAKRGDDFSRHGELAPDGYCYPGQASSGNGQEKPVPRKDAGPAP